ncbi:shikimate dehydrogenase [Mucilaginibacter koreensis]
MKKYGLIGHPLSHSFSKKYFTEKFEEEHIHNASYELYPLASIDQLDGLLKSEPQLCGLNVTVPHKVSVLPMLDSMSEYAREIGAVNCIRISQISPVTAAFSGEVGIEGKEYMLEGFNTDAYGFEMSLKPLLKAQHTSALILGDGGAARAVKYILSTLNISYKSVTRKKADHHITFDELTPEHIASHLLIINTTPLGTAPNIDECPTIPYEELTENHLLYDMVYNPEQTLFLKKGAEQGAVTKNGYEMLILQAEKSWEIWNSNEKHP